MSSEIPENAVRWMAAAFTQLLGRSPNPGDLAFTRCLAPEVMEVLAESADFIISGWEVRYVTLETRGKHEITAEQAVEWRESKESPPCLLLVDPGSAGPGMDGIYSSAREIQEGELFKAAHHIARDHVSGYRPFIDQALRKAKRAGRGRILSPWIEFLYLCEATQSPLAAGAALPRIGLWPIHVDTKAEPSDLDRSVLMVERLSSQGGAIAAPEDRVAALQLPDEQRKENEALAQILRLKGGGGTFDLLDQIAQQESLWLNRLSPGIFQAGAVSHLRWKSWCGKNGRPYKWSGLIAEDEQLVLLLNPNPEDAAKARLEVRWEVEPDALGKGAAEYLVTLETGLEDRLAEKTLTHTGKSTQKAVFGQDDFEEMDEGDFFEARVKIRTLGDKGLECESEEFSIRFGTTGEQASSGTGKVFPSLALAAADICDDRDAFRRLAETPDDSAAFGLDKKGHILCKTKRASARVYSPSLLVRLAKDWVSHDGTLGRWRAVVRADGALIGDFQFLSLDAESERFTKASREFSRWLGRAGEQENFRGPLGILYDNQDVFNEYILAAREFWSVEEPQRALVQTLEVVSPAGRSIGLIVLPTHPLRVAWQQGFDLLVMHHRYEEGLKSKLIQDAFSTIAGTYCPAFLPGVNPGEVFVFADNLGFHAAAMTPQDDPEPKATVALMARMLGDDESSAPSVGQGAAEMIGDEIARYMNLHPEYRRLKLMAIRAGDAKPVARAMGIALQKVEEYERAGKSEEGEVNPSNTLGAHCYELDLYPANPEEMESVGRFIASVSERRRTGAGSIPEEDRWLLESVTRLGGATLPKLRWTRREAKNPDKAAHLALAFDVFRSRVECHPLDELDMDGVLEIHGLALMPTRIFRATPRPHWISTIPEEPKGEAHPVTKIITRRQLWLQRALMRLVATSLGGGEGTWPVLVTEVDEDQGELLASLHQLSDWVITADRNAGIEYFDSPNELAEAFQHFVIDCTPERDDLGFMQLITSTSRLEEISRLLGGALGEMGLSNSEGNCRFILDGLKSISGRLALRLAQRGNATQEMIAMALTQHHCAQETSYDSVFPSLRSGIFVPLDDIPEVFQASGKGAGKRADLLYVVPVGKSGLQLIFIEVKYRRHLSTARASELVRVIDEQVEASCKRWEVLFGEGTSALEKTVKRAWLARVLRFYARKGLRHGLPKESFVALMREVDRLLTEKEYMLSGELGRRGLIFCPEYRSTTPDRVEHDGETEIFLFGPDLLPDQERVIAPIPQKSPLTEVADDSTESHVPGSSRSGMVGEKAIDAGSVDLLNKRVDEEEQSEPIEQKITSSTTDEPNPLAVAPAPEPTIADQPMEASDRGKADESGASPSANARILLGHRSPGAEPIHWETTIKANPHLMILGLPGMGKTTCLINLCRQLEAQEITPIVFSYHQDIDEKLAIKLDKPPQEIRFSGLGFNPLEIHDKDNPHAFLDNAGMLRDIFSAIFPDLGDVQLGAVRESIKKSYLDNGWSLGSAGEVPGFSAFLDILRNEPKPERNLLTRLNELDDYGLFSNFGELPSLLESTQTALIQIHGSQNELLQRAFATFVFYNLYQNMFRRGPQERITHAIIFDEAHRAARLRLLPTMAKECRKYGIALVVASQEAKDFDPSLYTAIAGYLAFRLNEVDAKFMARKFAPSDKVTKYADRMKQMDKYKAMLYGEGSGVAKVVSLLDEQFLDGSEP